MKKHVKIALALLIGAAVLFSLMLDATSFIMGGQFGRGEYPEDRSRLRLAGIRHLRRIIRVRKWSFCPAS